MRALFTWHDPDDYSLEAPQKPPRAGDELDSVFRDVGWTVKLLVQHDPKLRELRQKLLRSLLLTAEIGHPRQESLEADEVALSCRHVQRDSLEGVEAAL